MHTLVELTGKPPAQLLTAAGVRLVVPQKDDVDFETDCPECGGAVDLVGDLVRCCNPVCGFGTSRTVDLLAENLGGFGQVRHVLESRIPALAGHRPWARHAEHFLREAHIRRWLRGVALDPPAPTVKEQFLFGALRRAGLQALETHRLVAAAGKNFLVNLTQKGLDVPQEPSLFTGLWNPAGEFCGLLFFGIESHVLRFSADAFLTTWQPSTQGDLDVQEALQNASAAIDAGAKIVPAAVVGFEKSGECISIAAPTRGALVEAGRLSRLAPKLRVADVPADAWVREQITATADGLTSQARRALSVFRIPRTTHYLIEEELVRAGMLEAARELRDLRGCFEIANTKEGVIKAEPSGYVLGADTPLTNFTLELTGNVVFSALSEVWHTATVEVAGESFDVVVSSGDLAAVQKLEFALRSQARGIRTLPTIIDTNRVLRYLIPAWRGQAAALPQEPGVHEIGWADRYKMFQGAGWLATAEGVAVKPSIFRSDVKPLSVLKPVTDPFFDMDVDLGDMAPAAKDLIAILAGMLGRGISRRKVGAIGVKNTDAARRLCLSVFRGIGQFEVFDVVDTLRFSSFPGLGGHPLLIAGLNERQIDACEIPFVCLAERGLVIPDGDFTTAGVQAGHVLQRLVCALLRDSGAGVPTIPALLRHESLAREGAAAITAYLQAPWPVSPPAFPLIEAVATSWDGVFQRGDLLLIPSDAPEDLAIELRALGIRSEAAPSGLSVPKNGFLAAVSGMVEMPDIPEADSTE